VNLAGLLATERNDTTSFTVVIAYTARDRVITPSY
jgi:hypothetical protein